MAIQIGFRGKVKTQKVSNFNDLKLPEDIPSVSKYLSGKKNAKALRLLELLWMRCMNRKTGDCKFKTEEMAKLLEVTERSVYRYLDKLEKHEFISRLTQRRFEKQEDRFSATRFIRVRAAVYHTHYNIISAEKMLWANDFRPNAYYELQKIPLELKVTKFTTIQGKYGPFKVAPRFAYNKSDIAVPSLFHQEECAMPGKDIITASAWDEFYLLQDALEDPVGYPDQDRARKILGRSFQDYRTRYTIKTRHDAKKKIAEEATGHLWVGEPIPANEALPDFKEYKSYQRKAA